MQQRPLWVDPFAPLPTSSPLQPGQGGESASWPEEVQINSASTNNVARTTSRKRRISGTGSGNRRSQVDRYSQPPAAPEVPRAPPISYRGTYSSNAAIPGNTTSPQAGDLTSFAARARGSSIAEDLNAPEVPPEPEPLAQPTTQSRRRSTDRPSRTGRPKQSNQGLTLDSIQQPPITNGVPIQTSTSAQTVEHRQAPERTLHRPEVSIPISDQQPQGAAKVTVRSSTRRSSAGGVDPKTEWAPDRSPLQKLEVKLNDISKEEKRARVEKAEKKLRERQAEEERRRQNGDVRSPLEGRIMGGVADATTKQKEAPMPETTITASIPRDETRPKNRPVAPMYVEDIDQQQIERQQPLSKPRLVTVPARSKPRENTRSIQKESYSTAAPEQPSGRGVRFENGNGMEESNDTGLYDGQGSSRPQQKTREKELVQGARHSKVVPAQQQALFSSRAQHSGATDDPASFGGAPDPVSGNTVKAQNPAIEYQVPPQTAAGIEARQKVGFGGDPAGAITAPAEHHKHRLSKILHHGHKDVPTQVGRLETQPRHLDEWKQGGIARLTTADLVSEPDIPKEQNAWWERQKSSTQAGIGAKLPGSSVDHSSLGGTYSEDYGTDKRAFDPPLYLKCGPLLRYTGLKRNKIQNARTSVVERETWRGSVMIVTVDAQSRYNPAPTLTLTPEPLDLLPPPPLEINGESGHSLPPEYIDPVAGLPKLTRTGTTVYVKPAEDLEQEVDLSRVETDDGLFEEMRTANVPTSYGIPYPRLAANGQAQSAKLTPKSRGKVGRGQSVKGVRLHAERGVTFWRFNLEVELTTKQRRIGYSINNSASTGFWVPARGQSMNVMFHSCNGFSMSVNSATFSGPDPLWRDVLNSHQSRPFHVMIGGGDQIYNDAVMSQTKLFQEWLEIKNPHHKHEAQFSLDMQEELESFYLERYSMWFYQGLFGMANSQIPMVNMWDDHDIIDGFGSYPHHFMSTPVFCGLGAVAFKYYMLFQQQSVPDEGPVDEPSWLLGAAPGPYINELSRSIFLSLGKNVAFVALDCRTERMREEVISEATYDLVFDRCRRELIEGETKHLVVLLGVPIAYPRLVWLENLLTSRVMDPVKALSRAGMLSGFLNKFDGGVEILDDLDDHWTAKNHKRERNYFIQELQELASEKSVRVTILGGDVHLAAVGQFFSNPKLKISKDRDHRYMANVISSAIVNTPPPEMMGDILNKRNKTHHLDHDTDENMIPMFTHDVDGKPRNNKRLLPRRNWCSIREYQPGSTPPPTPSDAGTEDLDAEPPQRPGVLQRTLSLTRADIKPGNLIRRLSQRDNQPSAEYPISNEYRSSPAGSPDIDDHLAAPPKRQSNALSSTANNITRYSSAPLPRPGNFHRRPTNMSFKAVKKGGALEDDDEGHINLENGLDIVLNCEVSQKDPAGITVPYRLLIPALMYEGQEDLNDAPYRRKSLLQRFNGLRGGNRRSLAGNQGQGNWGKTPESSIHTETPSQTSDQQLQDDALGRGGTLGRLKRSLSGRGRKNISQEPEDVGSEPRVEGMGLFPRKSVAKKDISAPQLQRDTVSAEAVSTPPRGNNGFATTRSAPNPQHRAQGLTSTVTTTVTSSQPPQRQPSNANRVEGMGLFHRRSSSKAGTQPARAQQTPPQTAQQSQPLGLRMMEDRAQQQRQHMPDDAQADAGYPARRPSKIERMLGVGHAKEQSTGPSFAAREAARNNADDDYSTEGGYSDDYSYEESIGEEQTGKDSPPRGYGGIEAYKEGKGWKRLLGAKGKALVS